MLAIAAAIHLHPNVAAIVAANATARFHRRAQRGGTVAGKGVAQHSIGSRDVAFTPRCTGDGELQQAATELLALKPNGKAS
jgi:hypothetical protein